MFSRENLGGDVGKVKVIAWQNHIWDRRESDLETLIQSLNPEVIFSNQQSHLEQVHGGEEKTWRPLENYFHFDRIHIS